MQFFISNTVLVIMFILLAFLWLLGFMVLFIPYLLFMVATLFFFRRLQPAFREDSNLKEGLFFSPVNGRVVGVRYNVDHLKFGPRLTEVTIVTSWTREHGLYFPMRSEVKDFHYQNGKSLFRYFTPIPDQKDELNAGLCLTMTNSYGEDYGIQLTKCLLGFWPKVRIIPGDKGKAQVNFGVFGLGGITQLYLLPHYEILVSKGLEIVAGDTIIASRKEEATSSITAGEE